MSDGTANQGMFYCRMGTGLALTGLTLVFLTIADVAIAVIYKDILSNSDVACSLQASYGMLVVSTCGQAVIFVFDALLVYATARTKVACHCVCYHAKVIVHFCSCTLIFMATIIYGVKDPDKVGWSFWMALISGFFALMNGLMWLLTQQTKRFLKDAGVNVQNLESGLKHDGGDWNS